MARAKITIIATMIRRFVTLMLTTPQWMYLPAANAMSIGPIPFPSTPPLRQSGPARTGRRRAEMLYWLSDLPEIDGDLAHLLRLRKFPRTLSDQGSAVRGRSEEPPRRGGHSNRR